MHVDAGTYLERLNVLLQKLSNLKEQWQVMDTVQKQNFIQMVFGSRLEYTGGEYRTPFLHPIFSLNHLKMKSLGLDVYIKKADESAFLFASAPSGDLLEQIMNLAKIFAA